MNYITKVIRTSEGKATFVAAKAEGVTLSFGRGPGGKPVPLSRRVNALRAYPRMAYVSKSVYAQVMRQTCAIMYR